MISERVLGMPRERTMDKDVAFRDVPRSPCFQLARRAVRAATRAHLSRTRETDPEVPAAQEAGGAGTWGKSSWKAPIRIRWLTSAGQSSKSSWRVFWVCP